MPNRAACEKLAKELSACFISAVESMDEHWDSMGMSEKEKLRSIKRVAKSDPSPPSTTSTPSSIMSKSLQLKRDLDKLNALKSKRLEEAAPLIKAYDGVVGKIMHKKASSVGKDAKVQEHPTLLPESYISRAGTEALRDLLSKRKEELRVIEEEEEKLQEENTKLMEDLGLGVNSLSPHPPNPACENTALKEIKQSRVAKLRSLGDTIGKLWNELGVSNEERALFQAKVKATGIKPESQEVGQEEVKRL
ncbi:hypothetical protein TrRE_jg986, partial [Triparma retinervis]